MKGIQNFLFFLYENWTSIIVCIGLIIGIISKIKKYIYLTDQEKIEIAKSQITETILQLVTRAENDFLEWNKAGKIKRSQVINEIFDTYPILSKVIEQDKVVEWIDTQIETALSELNTVIKK